MGAVDPVMVRELRQKGVLNKVISNRLGITLRSVQLEIVRQNLPKRKPGRKAGYPMKEPKMESPKPIFERREIIFYPQAWSKKMDNKLFKKVISGYETLGSGYPAISIFAAKHNLTIGTVQARWHKIARRVA